MENIGRMSASHKRQPVIFHSYYNRQLFLRHRNSASNRLPFGWNLKSSAGPQQHYRRSRAHLSLQIDQEATEMEKCDEGVFVGYGWSGSFFRSNAIRQDIDMVTARINYRFGGPGVVRY